MSHTGTFDLMSDVEAREFFSGSSFSDINMAEASGMDAFMSAESNARALDSFSWPASNQLDSSAAQMSFPTFPPIKGVAMTEYVFDSLPMSSSHRPGDVDGFTTHRGKNTVVVLPFLILVSSSTKSRFSTPILLKSTKKENSERFLPL